MDIVSTFSPSRITPRAVLRIAFLAHADPKTVRRYLDELGRAPSMRRTRPNIAARIAEALRVEGLAVDDDATPPQAA